MNLKATIQKSYYGKAKLLYNDDVISLQSYDTIVCTYNKNTKEFTKTWHGYSHTTMNHIIDFCLLFKIPLPSDHKYKQWWTNLDKHQDIQQYTIVGYGILGQKHKTSLIFDDYDMAEDYAIELSDKNRYWAYNVEEL